MNLCLTDKVALVTGASAGLGFAAARALFDEGARVAICSRDETRIKAAAARLTTDTDRALPLVCDLTDPRQIDRMIASLESTFGRADILVANCGGPPLGRLASVTEQQWELGYHLTFMSAVRLVQKISPGMKDREFGRIVLMTSVSARQPIDNLLLSNSYRAGLLGFAKSISVELAPFGITVNTVMPGYTRTERLEYLAAGTSAQTGGSPNDVFAGWINSVPARRLGQPEELAAFIAFLASEPAGYITGTATAVDGGRTLGI